MHLCRHAIIECIIMYHRLYPPYPHVRLYVNIYVIYTAMLCMHTGESIRRYLYDTYMIYIPVLCTHRDERLANLPWFIHEPISLTPCTHVQKKKKNQQCTYQHWYIVFMYILNYTCVFIANWRAHRKISGIGCHSRAADRDHQKSPVVSILYCLSTPLESLRTSMSTRTSIAYTHLSSLSTPLESIHTSIVYTHFYDLYTLHSVASWQFRNFILLRFNVTAEVGDSRHNWGL